MTTLTVSVEDILGQKHNGKIIFQAVHVRDEGGVAVLPNRVTRTITAGSATITGISPGPTYVELEVEDFSHTWLLNIPEEGGDLGPMIRAEVEYTPEVISEVAALVAQAHTAVSDAQAAKTAAQTAVSTATAKAGEATAAASTATTKAGEAASAASTAATKASEASSSATTATGAATSATTAAGDAATAAGTALTAAGDALDANQDAQAAAVASTTAKTDTLALLNGFDVTAVAAEGPAVNVTVTKDGHEYELSFTIPKGPKGDPGEPGTVPQGQIDAAVAAVVGSAPETLDTLEEIATALGNDPSFATTISTLIGQKVSKGQVGAENVTIEIEYPGMPEPVESTGTIGFLLESLYSNQYNFFDLFVSKGSIAEEEVQLDLSGIGGEIETLALNTWLESLWKSLYYFLTEEMPARPAMWIWDGQGTWTAPDAAASTDTVLNLATGEIHEVKDI